MWLGGDVFAGQADARDVLADVLAVFGTDPALALARPAAAFRAAIAARQRRKQLLQPPGHPGQRAPEPPPGPCIASIAITRLNGSPSAYVAGPSSQVENRAGPYRRLPLPNAADTAVSRAELAEVVRAELVTSGV